MWSRNWYGDNSPPSGMTQYGVILWYLGATTIDFIDKHRLVSLFYFLWVKLFLRDNNKEIQIAKHVSLSARLKLYMTIFVLANICTFLYAFMNLLYMYIYTIAPISIWWKSFSVNDFSYHPLLCVIFFIAGHFQCSQGKLTKK